MPVQVRPPAPVHFVVTNSGSDDRLRKERFLRKLSLFVDRHWVSQIFIAVYAFDPGLDLRIASYFFDDATREFWLADHPAIISLRNLNSAIDIMIGVALAFARPVRCGWCPRSRRRSDAGLWCSWLRHSCWHPVLVANGMFKEHWSRPRRIVEEFGGASPFVPWWDPRGTCKRDAAVFSGEVSRCRLDDGAGGSRAGRRWRNCDRGIAGLYSSDRTCAHGSGWSLPQRFRFCGISSPGYLSGLSMVFAIGGAFFTSTSSAKSIT